MARPICSRPQRTTISDSVSANLNPVVIKSLKCIFRCFTRILLFMHLSIIRQFVLVLNTMALGVFNDIGHQEGTLSVVPGSATNHGRAGIIYRDFRMSLTAAKLGANQKAAASKDDAKQVSSYAVTPVHREA